MAQYEVIIQAVCSLSRLQVERGSHLLSLATDYTNDALKRLMATQKARPVTGTSPDEPEIVSHNLIAVGDEVLLSVLVRHP